MTHNNFIYIAVMALVSYAIRVLPLTLIRKPIKNQFIQSFLYYVPYVTLAVMTFPAIVEATQSPVAGAVALRAAGAAHDKRDARSKQLGFGLGDGHFPGAGRADAAHQALGHHTGQGVGDHVPLHAHILQTDNGR